MSDVCIVSHKLPGFFITARSPEDTDEREADTLDLIYALSIFRSLSTIRHCHQPESPSVDRSSSCPEALPAHDGPPTIENAAEKSSLISSRSPNRDSHLQFQNKTDCDILAGLCSRCQNVDWSLLASRRRFEQKEPVSMFALDDKCTLVQSKCALCRFFGTSMRESAEQHSPSTLWLEPAWVHSCAKLNAVSMRTEDHPHDQPWLDVGMIPQRIDGYDQTTRPRLVLPFEIDYGMLNIWIRRCQENHKHCVSQNETDELHGFRLIDCTTKHVVQASVSWHYVALSYVWGTGIFDPHDKWPLVMEDSMAVVLSLQYRYLWVDRYCIAQASEAAKMSQIKEMDRIYNQAELVIIAAAGDNPDYGLPGVSSRGRKPQVTIQLDGTTFVNMAPGISGHIRSSTWSSRAWTYQEGLLSRRRLIFTDHQVVFSCADAFFEEKIYDPTPYPPKHSPSYHPMSDLFLNHQREPRGPLYYCAEFSRRKISHDSDVLNALSGVLNFVRKNYGFIHLCGVPADIHNPGRAATVGLAWCHDTPVIRREAYPSWTWLGWKGPILSSYQGYTSFDVLVGKYFECSIVQADGTFIPCMRYADDFLNRRMTGNDELPQSLRITAHVLHPEFSAHDFGTQPAEAWTCRNGLYIPLNITTRLTILLYVYLDSWDEDLEGLRSCLALVLPIRKGEKFCLLLIRPAGSRYRRVGIAGYNIKWDTYTIPVVDSRGHLSIVGSSTIFVHEENGIIKRKAAGYWANRHFQEQLWFQDCVKKTIILE